MKQSANFIDGDMEVLGLELAGRGRRFGASLARDVGVIIGEMADAIEGRLDKPFVLVGHSLGGRLALALARELVRRSLRTPSRLYVVASDAPHVDKSTWSELDDDEFRAELRNYGGTPEEVLTNRELMDIFLPILRADFWLYEHFDFAERGADAVSCPIVGVWGKGDTAVTRESMLGWSRYTQATFDFIEVEGGHFFPAQAPQRFWSLVSDKESRYER